MKLIALTIGTLAVCGTLYGMFGSQTAFQPT